VTPLGSAGAVKVGSTRALAPVPVSSSSTAPVHEGENARAALSHEPSTYPVKRASFTLAVTSAALTPNVGP
jgi:hypothetical protein